LDEETVTGAKDAGNGGIASIGEFVMPNIGELVNEGLRDAGLTDKPELPEDSSDPVECTNQVLTERQEVIDGLRQQCLAAGDNECYSLTSNSTLDMLVTRQYKCVGLTVHYP
jgi:hypothetical protein